MRQDVEKTKKKRRKKKSKAAYYAYAIAILTLTVANVLLGIWLLTYVQSIEVMGNAIGGKTEIVSWIKEDPMTVNSIYTFYKFKGDYYELPIYIESVNVRLKAPWKVQVEVREKQIVGCASEGRAYVYFDSEGLVLKKTSQYDGTVPLVEGMEMINTGQFQYLRTENEDAYAGMIRICQEVEKRQFYPDRIIWEENSMNLYVDDICIRLGTNKYDEKLPELIPILEELEGKSGIVHMEHYNKGGIIRFEENPKE